MSEYRPATYNEARDALIDLQRNKPRGVQVTFAGFDLDAPLDERDRNGKICELSIETAGGDWLSVKATNDEFLDVWVREKAK